MKNETFSPLLSLPPAKKGKEEKRKYEKREKRKKKEEKRRGAEEKGEKKISDVSFLKRIIKGYSFFIFKKHV